MVTEYPTKLLLGMAKEGVTKPLVGLIAAFSQVPPGGFTVMVKGAALLQNGGTWLIWGVMVLVTGILRVLLEGQTVGFGLEVVL